MVMEQPGEVLIMGRVTVGAATVVMGDSQE